MTKENDPNAPENAVDMDRYYYRPGTTEPELRPEIAAAEAQAAEPKAEKAPAPKAAKAPAKKK